MPQRASRAPAAPPRRRPDCDGATLVAWRALLAWIALRFLLLGMEVSWQPLYPWDAWTQWATKARVWFELGRIVPFAGSDAWFAAGGAAYFDAAPGNPPTVPLLQVWACIALGRWDDALMNWPWWQIAVALALAVYGALRALDMSALAALVVTFFVASLPLANVHVALAGYADLPLAACYTCAVLALLRWIATRDPRDAWPRRVARVRLHADQEPRARLGGHARPGVIVALLPAARRQDRRARAWPRSCSLLAVLAQTSPTFLGYRAASRFRSGMAGAGRQLLPVRHLESAVVRRHRRGAAGLARSRVAAARPADAWSSRPGAILLFVVFAFPDARAWLADQTHASIAPRCISRRCWSVFAALAFRAFALRWTAAASRRRSRERTLTGSRPIDVHARTARRHAVLHRHARTTRWRCARSPGRARASASRARCC